MKNYFVFSFKSLKHRGTRSWLTLLGIVIGVSLVVSLFLLGTGLRLAITSQFGISSTEIISVRAGGINAFGPPGFAVANPLIEKDFEEIKKTSGVEKAIKRYIRSATLEYKEKKENVFLTSVPEDEDKFLYEILDLQIEQGRFLLGKETKKALLGYNFFKDKGITPSSKIKLNGEIFEVVGILKRKGSFTLDGVIFLSEKDLEKISEDRSINVIAVKPYSSDQIDKVKENIEKNLRKIREVKIGQEDFEVSTPKATLSTINSILNGVKIFVVIIASISIIVGIIGITNTMTTSVLERRKDIGIMKSIGAKNSQIFLLFLIESGFLGFIGGLLGIIFGIIFAYFGIIGLQNFINTEIPLNIDFLLIFISLLSSFLIGALAGTIPALQASKLKPIETLRE
ncbi:MAG: ABC transporter permease [Candidatus Pacearchaeota archaeon]